MERVRPVCLVLEIVLSSHILCTVTRIVYLQVLQSDFFVLYLLSLRRLCVHISVFRALETSLGIFGAVLEGLVDDGVDGLLALRDETVLALVLVHNSIQRADFVFTCNHHRLYHFKLVIALSHTLSSSLAVALAFGARRPNRSLQVELPTVLILRRCRMMDTNYSTLIEAHGLVCLVAQLRIVGRVDRRCSPRWHHVRRMSLVCISGLNR